MQPVAAIAAIRRTDVTEYFIGVAREIILPLRHDPFKPHLAGMGEDGRAVALDVLVEPDAGSGLGHDRCKRGLADRKPIAPEIVAVLLAMPSQ